MNNAAMPIEPAFLPVPLPDDPRLVDGRQSAAAAMVQRGVGRLMIGFGFSVVTELTFPTGRRADVVALGPKGDVWIVEIKSSLEDFRADHKWPEYRDFCDRLFFASHAGVSAAIFPEEAGLIVADGFGGAVLREAPEHRLAPAARRAVTLRFAHAAARRFHGLLDPNAGGAS